MLIVLSLSVDSSILSQMLLAITRMRLCAYELKDIRFFALKKGPILCRHMPFS